MTMQLAKIRHLSAVRARSILTAIQAGKQLAPAPYFVSSFVSNEKTTGYEELFEFLQESRAAAEILNYPEFAARTLIGWICGRQPEGEDYSAEKTSLRAVYRFIYRPDRLNRVIEAALEDLEYLDEDSDQTLEWEIFEAVQSVLTDMVESDVHTTGVTFNGGKYSWALQDGEEVTSAVSEVRSGLRLFWIKNLGMYAACSAYASNSSVIDAISDDDIEVLNRLYFNSFLSEE